MRDDLALALTGQPLETEALGDIILGIAEMREYLSVARFRFAKDFRQSFEPAKFELFEKTVLPILIAWRTTLQLKEMPVLLARIIARLEKLALEGRASQNDEGVEEAHHFFVKLYEKLEIEEAFRIQVVQQAEHILIQPSSGLLQ